MSMISELVKELRRADNPVGGYYRTLYARAADTIEELSAKLATANIERSTAYCNDGWIPCSERLPEERQKVLVTLETFTGMRFVRMDWIVDGNWWLWNSDNVTAWMPLPEPYKGGGEDA